MAYFVLASVLVLLILLYQNITRPSVLFFSFLCLFFVFGLISVDNFLLNFINPSLVSLIILIIVAAVITKTDLLSFINKIDNNKYLHMLKLSSILALLSAFVSNALVTSLALKTLNKNPKTYNLLLPIGYIAIVGGVCTLIGCSTNLIINSFVVSSGMKSLNMFDFAYVGIPLTLAGIIYITLFSNYVLKKTVTEIDSTPSNYFLEAKVLTGSPLINKTVKENRLRNLENIFLAEIIRNSRLISPVSPDETIFEGDILVFTGEIDNIKDLQQFKGLQIFEEKNEVLKNNLAWVVLSHNSSLIGKTIKEVNFRSKFDAAIVAVKRGSEKLSGKIGSIKLKAGDYLILAVSDDFNKNEAVKEHFYFSNQLDIANKLNFKQSVLVIVSFLIAIFLVVLGVISLLKALIILLFLFFIFKCISFDEIKSNYDFELVLLVGSALGISKVLIDSGASSIISDLIVVISSKFGVYGCFIGIYLMTVIFTEIIHNNAAAALVFPIAYTTAISLGVNPLSFVMVVAYGASASFLTPYGYHVNLMVYSTGNYKPGEFFRLGLPLSIIYGILVLLLVPIFFKF